MKPSLFDKLATLRAKRIAAIDDQEIAPKIRNHLLQLFRAARAVDSGIEGVLTGMGHAGVSGTYLAQGDQDPDANAEDRGARYREASHWEPSDEGGAYQPVHPEVEALFIAVNDYDGLLCNGRASDLPYIDNITLDDLKTRNEDNREPMALGKQVKKRITRTRRAS